ncbi:unnamed protein product [Gongylonema pulchrum]|uniref:COMM domain-containing protein n=1 Tax=Gongylonema pulchrum TaxID=637853 RepID=A0A183DZ17_9BILA|nr:unnamed protein product [Gongylonema pulchrum]
MATAFPADLIRSVEQYGAVASSNDFEYICTELCRKLVSVGPAKLEESICSQVYWNAAAGVLVEAARRGLSAAALEQLLPKNNFADAIVRAFKENEKSIVECMATIGWEPPRVIDIAWKLSKTLEVNGAKKERAVAEIHLDALPTGSTNFERISFCCSSDDLQVTYRKLSRLLSTATKNFLIFRSPCVM